jgi:hypothetical protein
MYELAAILRRRSSRFKYGESFSHIAIRSRFRAFLDLLVKTIEGMICALTIYRQNEDVKDAKKTISLVFFFLGYPFLCLSHSLVDAERVERVPSKRCGWDPCDIG